MEKKAVLVSFFILVVLALGGAGIGLYYYRLYSLAVNRSTRPRPEVKSLLEKLSTLIELPLSEEPTVATVTNADQINAQPFFAKAQNGHRVIIYTNSKLVILYDDAANKIINVGSFTMDSTASASAMPGTAPGVNPSATLPPIQ